MQNILTLPLCQGGKNHDKITNQISYGIIDKRYHNCESTMPSLEDTCVAKAKEALSKKLVALKEAIQLSDKPTHKTHPNNITETPSFHEAKAESLELSDSAKETFARIGERARSKSLNEQIEEARAHFKQTFTKQQTKRAKKYNIPFDASSVDYHQLSRKIDQYEFLLDEAKRWDISWDIKVYDPAVLEQELEGQTAGENSG
jgi:hypothetical protein